MGKIKVDGVLVTPLKKITNTKGDILHALKKSDSGFFGFGEAYFSMVNKGEIKGWNRHKMMTANIIIPSGEVTFIICRDKRENSKNKQFFRVDLSLKKYNRLTISPGLWFAFKGVSQDSNLVLNIADIEHDPNEMERLELSKIDYNWENI